MIHLSTLSLALPVLHPLQTCTQTLVAPADTIIHLGSTPTALQRPYILPHSYLSSYILLHSPTYLHLHPSTHVRSLNTRLHTVIHLRELYILHAKSSNITLLHFRPPTRRSHIGNCTLSAYPSCDQPPTRLTTHLEIICIHSSSA